MTPVAMLAPIVRHAQDILRVHPRQPLENAVRGGSNDLIRRLWEHRAGIGSKFTDRYAIHRLVHIESTSAPRDAIAREKQIKSWSRRKKVALIESTNPDWLDLAARSYDGDAPLSG